MNMSSAQKFQQHPSNVKNLRQFVPYIQCKSCDEVTKQNRSNFFTAFKFLSKEKAEALVRVYAYFRIADDCVDELQLANEQNAALNFWEDEIRKVYRHENAHPVVTDLNRALTRFQIPESYFTGLIEGCRMDVTHKQYESFDELYEYCYRVAGLVGLTCIKVFEYESDTSEKFAVDLGLAFQLTNILRDIRGDLALGRVYLPTEDMTRFGYSAAELKANIHNPQLVKLLQFYADKAYHYYELAEQEFTKDHGNKLVAARMMSKVYKSILNKLVKQNFPIFEEKISIPRWQKALMMIPIMLSCLWKK